MRNIVITIIQVYFHRLSRAQQGLLNTVTKLAYLGCYYEVVGGTTIQQYTCRYSTKWDMQLQKLISIRLQNIWSKNLKQKCRKYCLDFYITVLL